MPSKRGRGGIGPLVRLRMKQRNLRRFCPGGPLGLDVSARLHDTQRHQASLRGSWARAAGEVFDGW